MEIKLDDKRVTDGRYEYRSITTQEAQAMYIEEKEQKGYNKFPYRGFVRALKTRVNDPIVVEGFKY